MDRERPVESFVVDCNPPERLGRTKEEISFILLLVFGPIVRVPVSRISMRTFS